MDLEANLDRIKEDVDLFGEKHQRLEMAERIGFVPLSIWKPDWELVKTLKELVGDAGETRNLVGRKPPFRKTITILATVAHHITIWKCTQS